PFVAPIRIVVIDDQGSPQSRMINDAVVGNELDADPEQDGVEQIELFSRRLAALVQHVFKDFPLGLALQPVGNLPLQEDVVLIGRLKENLSVGKKAQRQVGEADALLPACRWHQAKVLTETEY